MLINMRGEITCTIISTSTNKLIKSRDIKVLGILPFKERKLDHLLGVKVTFNEGLILQI